MKIRRDFAQGTPEWRAARLGRITASEASRILTAKKLEPSAQSAALVGELAAELMMGVPCDDSTDGWRQRGLDIEAEARDWFSLVVQEVEQVGFIEHDELMVGCSPDGIVEGEFGLEVKCPAAKTHAGYVADPRTLVDDYRMQVQFGLWLTRWPRWALLSYCPGMAQVVRWVIPSEECHRALDLWVPKLLLDVDAVVERLRGGALVG